MLNMKKEQYVPWLLLTILLEMLCAKRRSHLLLQTVGRHHQVLLLRLLPRNNHPVLPNARRRKLIVRGGSVQAVRWRDLRRPVRVEKKVV